MGGERNRQVAVGRRLLGVAPVDEGRLEGRKLAAEKIGEVPLVRGRLSPVEVEAQLAHGVGGPDAIDHAGAVDVRHDGLAVRFDAQVMSGVAVRAPDLSAVAVPTGEEPAFAPFLEEGQPIEIGQLPEDVRVGTRFLRRRGCAADRAWQDRRRRNETTPCQRQKPQRFTGHGVGLLFKPSAAMLSGGPEAVNSRRSGRRQLGFRKRLPGPRAVRAPARD